MKSIVFSKTPNELVHINSVNYDGKCIIAYHTNGSTGWAILQEQDCDWGFVYLRDLLQGDYHCTPKYKGSTLRQAIKSVKEANKEVYYFDDMNDFLRNASCICC